MDLAEAGRKLRADLALNCNWITDETIGDLTVISLGEEAGELLGAYRRYSGRARRNGSLEEVRLEMADVLLNLAILADVLGIDIEAALQDKLKIVYSRGWREPGYQE